jgi:hypothetical protein
MYSQLPVRIEVPKYRVTATEILPLAIVNASRRDMSQPAAPAISQDRVRTKARQCRDRTATSSTLARRWWTPVDNYGHALDGARACQPLSHLRQPGCLAWRN